MIDLQSGHNEVMAVAKWLALGFGGLLALNWGIDNIKEYLGL